MTGGRRDAPGTARTGLILIDKPSGPTSHDVVGRLRAILRTRRVGHAGTLDPMATGLLVAGVGRATKLLGHLALEAKSYRATMRLGQATDSDDADGQVISRRDATGLTADEIITAMAGWTGNIDQVPSAVSAVKIDGKRAYARVRDGEQVQLSARSVSVTRFAVTAPIRAAGGIVDVDVAVDCTTGTYVRALARDVGTALGVGGHLTALRRTAIGPFEVSDACDLYPDGVPERGAPRPLIDEDLRERVTAAVRDTSQVARMAFAGRDVDAARSADLRHGRPIPGEGRAGVYAAFDPGGELLALLRETDGAARPVFVWQPAG